MKITVSITSYNQKGYLKEAIDSVLLQTVKPHQIIIIDDCSDDGSRELISDYKNTYPDLITSISHDKNMGVIYSRNEALRLCSGDYHTFLDGDDRFLPNKLEKESALINDGENVKIVFSNINYIDENGKVTRCWSEDIKPPIGDVFKYVFARKFPKGNLFRSELVNIKAWREIGYYDEGLKNLYEDYDMRIRLTKHFNTAYCDEVLSEYRIHAHGLSRVDKVKHLESFKYILKKNKSLLDDLSDKDKKYILKNYNDWLCRFSAASSRDSWLKGRWANSLRYLIESFKYKVI